MCSPLLQISLFNFSTIPIQLIMAGLKPNSFVFCTTVDKAVMQVLESRVQIFIVILHLLYKRLEKFIKYIETFLQSNNWYERFGEFVC